MCVVGILEFNCVMSVFEHVIVCRRCKSIGTHHVGSLNYKSHTIMYVVGIL